MANKIWLRQETESAKAYEAAKCYFEMGAKRSVEAVGQKLGKSKDICERWSSKYDWVARAKAYDARQHELDEKAREKAAQVEAEKWAKRREELRNEEWKLAERIHSKLAQMLEFPVYEVSHTNEHGQQMIVKPLNWSVRDVTRMAETVAKLYRTSAGMPVETTRQEITGADGGAIEITNAASEFERRLAALFERATTEEVSSEPDDSGQSEA